MAVANGVEGAFITRNNDPLCHFDKNGTIVWDIDPDVAASKIGCHEYVKWSLHGTTQVTFMGVFKKLIARQEVTLYKGSGYLAQMFLRKLKAYKV